ncbi:hypothetical protein D7Z26_13305 [Cohnella endophytica]|uniref:Uncharacterized protein n=1 Tax=Cohnella endophytica TaxID=2419778 RepID=A0A494XUN1_9BACL|nr:hypothetical protein [Cohnella endophytica]RKP54333.1 hypothetical protein D7Z26_13305 [Cohnella endophytica]
MENANQVNLSADFFLNKLEESKVHFERALDCKHTEFDDLYPYMIEHPQFFWYKRYVAWSELLTIVKLCEDMEIPWAERFEAHQAEYVAKRVMSSKVLDCWYETNDTREHVG